jgi:FkbM family methyltransferase
LLKTRFFNFFRKIFLVPLAEKWLVKKTQQREITQMIARFPPNHYQYKKGSIRQVDRNGLNFRLDLSDFVQWRTFWGILDVGKERLISQIQPGDFFLDVGANIGEICLHAAKQVGKQGMIWAFEPIPITLKNLEHNISLNPSLHNLIQVFPFALGEKEEDEIAFIHPRKDNQGMIRIQPKGETEAVFTTAPMRSLDRLLAKKSVRRIDGIKIDVEGYELKVLKGAKGALSQFHPWLFIELDDDNLQAQGDSAKELVGFLENLGYVLQDAATQKTITSKDSFADCHFDLFAFFERQ